MGCREGREKYVSLIVRCMNNVKEKYLRDLHEKFIKKAKIWNVRIRGLFARLVEKCLKHEVLGVIHENHEKCNKKI